MAFRPDIHYFRGFAICGVVMAHVADNFVWPDNSLTLRGFFSAIWQESSVWFFFIAGFLFQHLSARFKAENYLKSKWKNVIVPYIIWSIPAMIFVTQFAIDKDIPPSFYGYDLLTQVALLLVTGYQLGPLWFVPAIFLIYLLAPLLIKADRSGWLYYSLVPLLVLSTLIGRGGLVHHDYVGPYLRQLDNAIYLLSPYVLGMFFSRYYDSIMQLVRRRHVWLVAAVLLAMLISIIVPDTRDNLLSYRFIFKIVACPLIVYYLSLTHTMIWGGMSVLADYSFGIFFLHGYVVAFHRMLLKYLDLPMADGDIPTVILATFVVLAICVGVLWAVKRMFGTNSRVLVGC